MFSDQNQFRYYTEHELHWLSSKFTFNFRPYSEVK